MSDERREKRLRGVPASPSIATGKILFVGQKTPERSRRIAQQEIEAELSRFVQALVEVDQQLAELQAHFIADRGATSLILEAYRLMLKDPLLVEGTQTRIAQELWCAEAALRHTQQEIAQSFDTIDDDYLRSRKSEVTFVMERIVQRLQEQVYAPFSFSDAIIVSQDLSPMDVALYTKKGARGFIAAGGGPMSHAMIVARALGLPGVVGVRELFSQAAEGDTVIVDGLRGEVIVQPSLHRVQEYEQKRLRFLAAEKALLQNREQEAVTIDGVRLELQANVELLEELPGLSLYGAKGIGLFRTEFLFLHRNKLPDEEEQYHFAKEVLQKTSGVVTFRTLDLGGDKLVAQGAWPKGETPSPNLRAIRLCLMHPELFRPQLRALLRASYFGSMRLLLPMITGLAELREAKVLISQLTQELSREGLFTGQVPIGVMIETPGAVMMADALAREADFFCVGSNDLIQYTLAIDRSEESLSPYYRPHHPAIIRMLHAVIIAAQGAKIPVSLCGEMAAEPLYTALFVGLGLRELSMTPSAIPAVKQALRGFTAREAKVMSQQALRHETAPEIEVLLRSFEQERSARQHLI
jgi:phosphoenolpyruvate-protein phosphotransferase (PTS system enzyme I)